MITRHASIILLTMLAVVVAIGVSAAKPREADAATITVQTCTGGTIGLNSEEKQMLDLHNKARKSRGLKLLCVHPALTEAARAHSQEMIDKDYFSHNSYNGDTVKVRLALFGYTFIGYSYYWYGENIAWGSGSNGAPDNRFKWWMNSSGHRANILNKNFREVGIGVRTGNYKTYSGATMYTVDFGTRR